MAGLLSVEADDSLKAAVLAFKAADKGLRKRINDATRDTMNPVWRSLVTANLGGTRAPTSAVLSGGVRIAAGNPPVAKAAQSTRNVGHGGTLVPARQYAAWEFGVGNKEAYSRYTRKNRKGGGTHQVARRTMRGLPPRRREGWVVYPAFGEIGPRLVSLWVQLIVKVYSDAAEGKR